MLCLRFPSFTLLLPLPQIGMTIHARVLTVNVEKFSVDLTCRSSDLKDSDGRFRSHCTHTHTHTSTLRSPVPPTFVYTQRDNFVVSGKICACRFQSPQVYNTIIIIIYKSVLLLAFLLPFGRNLHIYMHRASISA